MYDQRFKNWFTNNLEKNLTSLGYEVKIVIGDEHQFGSLYGIQIDSEFKAGHIYCYSSGFYNFHLYDFENDCDLVDDTHGYLTDAKFADVLNPLLSKL